MRSCYVLLSVTVACLAGCGGGSDLESVVPVSGKVLLNGQPLANASVVFLPSETLKNAPTAMGKTDAAGAFQLKVSTTDQSGAVPGKYRVRIQREVSTPASDTDAGNSGVVEDSNALPEQSFEVPASGTDAANFDVKKS